MTDALDVALLGVSTLQYTDGAPVRAASGIVRFERGWLVVSDDATHAAVWAGETITRLRILPSVDGHDEFDEASGTKRLKPDLEAACRVEGDRDGVLLLGSGSLPRRMRGVFVEEHRREVHTASLAPLYERVAATLDIPVDALNLEGACTVGAALRWFQRGNTHLGSPSASVDIDLFALVAALRGQLHPGEIELTRPMSYALDIDGIAELAVTDSVSLPGGRVLVSAAAEDTPNAVDDGPVTASALFLLAGDRVVARGLLPDGPSGPQKVEGLAVAEITHSSMRILAVVDADDPQTPSQALDLSVNLR